MRPSLLIFEVIIKCVYRTSTAGGAVKTANMKYSSIKATWEYSVRTGKEYSRFVCQRLLVPGCPGDLPLLQGLSRARELLQQQRAPQPCRYVAYSYVAQLPLARLGEAFGGTSNSLPLDLQPDTSTGLF